MANCLIGFPNNIDTATLSGGSWRATLPQTNLQETTLGRVARTSDAAKASTVININHGRTRQTRIVSLVNHNISINGKYRLRATGEASTTNYIRNNTMIGAAAGTPGVLPNNWQFQNSAVGVSSSIVGVGVEGGIEYLDVRFFGVVTTAGSLAIRPEAYPYPTAAAAGQTWTSSVFLRLVAGAFTGVTSHFLVLEETDASNTYLSGAGYLYPAPTSANLLTQRVSATRLLVSPTTAKVGGYIAVSVALGSAVDFTLRVGLPQLEKGSTMTSAIRTYGTAVTRPEGYMDDWQSYAYDSGWTNVWPVVYPYPVLEWEDDRWWSGKYSAEELEGSYHTLVSILPGAVTLQYWRLEIDDTGNPDGFIQAGRVFVGPAWQPTKNPSFGMSTGWETKTDVQTALGGAEYFGRRTPFRTTRFTFDYLSEDEGLSNAFDLDRRAGIDKEVFWVHDPDDTVHANRRQYLGRLRTLSPIEYPYFNTTKKPFEIKESL